MAAAASHGSSRIAGDHVTSHGEHGRHKSCLGWRSAVEDKRASGGHAQDLRRLSAKRTPPVVDGATLLALNAATPFGLDHGLERAFPRPRWAFRAI